MPRPQQQPSSFFSPRASPAPNSGPGVRQPSPQSHLHHHHHHPQGGSPNAASTAAVSNFPPSSRSNAPASGSPRSQATPSPLSAVHQQQHPQLGRGGTPPNVPFGALGASPLAASAVPSGASVGQNPPAVPPRPPGQEFTPLRPISRSGSGEKNPLAV